MGMRPMQKDVLIKKIGMQHNLKENGNMVKWVWDLMQKQIPMGAKGYGSLQKRKYQ